MSISSLLVRGLKKGRWTWNDNTNELQFACLVKEKKQKKQKEMAGSTAINGLTYAALKVDLKFKATVNEVELMDFRHFLKKRNQGREDSIVTIQDCKIVAIFLCIQQLPSLFHKFYNLLSVNQLLRACIVYIQFYLQTCETIVKTQHYLRGNPLSPGRTSAYQGMKDDLDDLRVLIGRFYAGIIFAELGSSDISKTDEILLFEYFLRVSTVVVWIALERKYLNVIKVELERVFRTGYYNNFIKKETNNILSLIKNHNHSILSGKISDIDKKKTKAPSRLTSNSPIIHNFLRLDEPKLVMIGRKHFEETSADEITGQLENNSLNSFIQQTIAPDDFFRLDDRLQFLTKYIFIPETEIQEEGVSIGILGLHRRLFDPLLYPCSKRVLKLLVTGSPMDISEDRKMLRESAMRKALRESEPVSPHIFDELEKIPRSNVFTKGAVEDVEEEEAKEEEVEEEGEGFVAEEEDMWDDGEEDEEDEISFHLDL